MIGTQQSEGDIVMGVVNSDSKGARSFEKTYNDIVCRIESDMDAWIKKLESEGVKAAHPDDGWVDRVKNEVILNYPNFMDIIEIGDRIALGTPYEYRLVVVNNISMGAYDKCYHFSEIESGLGVPYPIS